jgi:hypothetical protein
MWGQCAIIVITTIPLQSQARLRNPTRLCRYFVRVVEDEILREPTWPAPHVTLSACDRLRFSWRFLSTTSNLEAGANLTALSFSRLLVLYSRFRQNFHLS